MAKKRDKRAKRLQRQAAIKPSYAGRRRVVIVLFTIAAGLLTWRAFDQQVVQTEFLQAEANERQLDTVDLPAHRGLITDRNGAVLAMSTPAESLIADPLVLRLDERSLPALANALSLSASKLARRLEHYSKRRFVYLSRRMEPNQSDAVRDVIETHELSGLQFRREYKRYYPASEVLSQLLGFTDYKDEGQEGLEKAYEASLAGRVGSKRVRRDGSGQVVADIERITVPRSGRHLALSIDLRLQFVAYRELLAALRAHNAKAANAVLLDVQTGEILAVVNQPSFNPNGSRRNLRGKVRNRALTDAYEPGSTMKPFTVAAALNLGKFRADSVIDTSPGYFDIGGYRVSDHDNLGKIDLATVLRKSSNVAAGRIALDLPPRALWQYLSELGFGVAPNTGFPRESAGILRLPEDWARIDQATLSYGYGVSTTTLQLARAYATLAADGVVRPVSLLRVESPPDGRRVFSARTARTVRGMLETVVTADGTAPEAAISKYRVAGKTGTAKKSGPNGYTNDYISLFAGMAPAGKPRLAMVVMIDEPSAGAIYGGEVAAPVFAAVMEGALRILGVPPDAVSEPTVRLAQAGESR